MPKIEKTNIETTENDNINPNHYVFGGIETIEYLKATYAPKIKITKKESEMLKSLKRMPQIGVGIVDYSGREPKVLLSNEFKFVDAWLHPELIEVSDG